MKPGTLRWLPLLAFGALLLGCSPYSLAAPPSVPLAAFGPARTDVATVCVIRPSHWALAVTFVVRDDGQLVGATRGESYFCYFAQPGDHSIVSSTGDGVDWDGHAALTVVAGKRYWLHQDYENVVGPILDRLQRVGEARARELLDEGGCEYKVLVAVPGAERLPGAVPFAPALAAQ
jgi:hypothetical protein